MFNILEGRLAVLLVNPQHIKQVPGRKTDVGDCAWIAQLLQHGLLTASFIPPARQRELRDLTRQRSQLGAEQTAVANGGAHAMDKMDHGFMYGWSFYDPDGHHFEVVWMNPEATDA